MGVTKDALNDLSGAIGEIEELNLNIGDIEKLLVDYLLEGTENLSIADILSSLSMVEESRSEDQHWKVWRLARSLKDRLKNLLKGKGVSTPPQIVEAVANSLEANHLYCDSRLNLSSQSIGYNNKLRFRERSHSIKPIALALRRNNTLRSLNLSRNQIGYQDCVALAEALTENTTLVDLDLSKNGFQYEKAEGPYTGGLLFNVAAARYKVFSAFASMLEQNMSLQKLDLMWIPSRKYHPKPRNQAQIDKINHCLDRNKELHKVIAAGLIDKNCHPAVGEDISKLIVGFAEGPVLLVNAFLEKYSDDVNEAMITYVQAKLGEEHRVTKAFKIHYSVANQSKYTMMPFIRDIFFANYRIKPTTFEDYIIQRKQEKHEYFGCRFSQRTEAYTKTNKISKVTEINNIITRQLTAWHENSEHAPKPDLTWVRKQPYYQENQHVFEDGRTGEILRSEYWLKGAMADEESEAALGNYSN